MQKTIELYEIMAKKGNAFAQSRLGFCYLKGEVVQKNMKKAIEMFEKSAKQGNASAQNK